jgi:hypothetical protein
MILIKIETKFGLVKSEYTCKIYIYTNTIL